MSTQQAVLNGAGTHVWLCNPATKGTWACPVGVADFYRGRGWENSEAPGPTLDGLFDASTAEGSNQTGFDPAEHDVDEVNAHLVEHAESSPGEVDRVLQLEAAGKNRKTVVDPRPPVNDDITDDAGKAGGESSTTGD